MPESEAQFQAKVVQWARLNGWLVYHTHDSRRSEPGFPDLVLVRGPDILYWELKAEKGRVSPEQERWIAALHGAGQETRILRPSDWAWLAERLRRHAHR